MCTSTAVHGGYTDWSDWSDCSFDDYCNKKIRTRSCTNPTPLNGGDDCSGPASEEQDCDVDGCRKCA